jgi:hypothetical protein
LFTHVAINFAFFALKALRCTPEKKAVKKRSQLRLNSINADTLATHVLRKTRLNLFADGNIFIRKSTQLN